MQENNNILGFILNFSMHNAQRKPCLIVLESIYPCLFVKDFGFQGQKRTKASSERFNMAHLWRAKVNFMYFFFQIVETCAVTARNKRSILRYILNISTLIFNIFL